MKFRSVLLAAGMALCGASAALADDDAVAMAQAFCSLRTVEGGNALMHLVSPSLREEIGKALAENAKMQEAAPDEKPPLGDGIPWHSRPDVSDTCEAGAVTAEGQAWIDTGPHVMVLGGTDQFAGYPATAANTSVPYVMWTGTPYQHLMIPVR